MAFAASATERFVRALETVLRMRRFETTEVPLTCRRSHDENWLVERHDHRPPPSDKGKP